jgi:toxin-antitoxin system PIN domain toxin
MILLDANIPLYAYNSSSSKHLGAKRYFEQVLSSNQQVGLAWVVILAFLRISTNSRAFPQPLAPADARAIVSTWLEQPNVVVLSPGPHHWHILDGLLAAVGVAGNLTTDAHLAALAIENGALLASCDSDFGQFTAIGFEWINPLAKD